MTRKIISFVLIGLFSLTVATPLPANENADDIAGWDLDVYLNDRRVGKHSYGTTEEDGIKSVRSQARTNAIGERIEASGEKSGTRFTVDNGATPVDLPECVMSFAYWNPEFLEERRLVNPRTGEYVDVSVEQLTEEVVQVRGQYGPAKRFKLTAYEFDLTLWYSADNQWLALDSVVEGGHIIRYELS
ncbi:MAG: hypothetical protein OER22_07690 [Gammaproteobacteria bacterium]|nr:hypothetical protein [Gammaproteobacteria bacterium]MDH3410778.1 hypothetical protein [Gammaproteobacteria bacterium]MDH3552482.1 hypothetical protein [Gammaproteobacteria bacterium]